MVPGEAVGAGVDAGVAENVFDPAGWVLGTGAVGVTTKYWPGVG